MTGPDLFNELVDSARTLLERADALTAAVHTNHQIAAPAIADDYAQLLQDFADADKAVSAAEWNAALEALRPALTSHLENLATNSWRGRGIAAPPDELRAQYVQEAVDTTLKQTSDIRRRFNSSIAGKANRESPDTYVARAEQTSASLINRAQDRLFEDYAQWAADNNYITSKIWTNPSGEDSRNPQMQDQEVPVSDSFVDPDTGDDIEPRDPSGSQSAYSGSSATIRYRLTSGKVV